MQLVWLICFSFVLCIFYQPIAAAIPTSFYGAMSIIDSSWQLNFTQNYGSPALACNCSTMSNGSFYPCLWNTGSYGFFCTNGNLTSIIFEQPLSKAALTIPNEINLLNSLTILNLINTNLAGILPNLANLTNLSNLNLYNNSLTNDLNGNLNNLVNLKYLYLSYNNFVGNVSWLDGLTSLIDLDLSNNQFTGVITINFTNLALQQLLLNNNSFIGPIPSSIATEYFDNINFCNLKFNNFDQCNNSGGLLAININCLVGCYPSTNDCPNPAPTGNATCYNGQWQIIGNVVNSGQIVITGNTIISGNFSQSPNSTLVITNGSSLVILGTATLDGTLVVNVNSTIGLVPILTATIIVGNFSSINIIKDKNCLKHNIIQTSNSLSVLLTSDSCNKNKNYITIIIIVVSVVVPIVLIIAGIFLIFTYHTKFIPLFGYVKEDNYFR